MLPADSEEGARESARIVSDSRSIHYYDNKKQVGKVVAESIGGKGQVAWDIYLFYLHGSKWSEKAPIPKEWLHQLDDALWAARSRFRSK